MFPARVFAMLQPYLQGDDEAAVAERLGVSSKTVRRNLRRAFEECPGLEWAAEVVRGLYLAQRIRAA